VHDFITDVDAFLIKSQTSKHRFFGYSQCNYYFYILIIIIVIMTLLSMLFTCKSIRAEIYVRHNEDDIFPSRVSKITLQKYLFKN
jgi:hypothetical protein